jgi:hypothetical protein
MTHLPVVPLLEYKMLAHVQVHGVAYVLSPLLQYVQESLNGNEQRLLRCTQQAGITSQHEI